MKMACRRKRSRPIDENRHTIFLKIEDDNLTPLIYNIHIRSLRNGVLHFN